MATCYYITKEGYDRLNREIEELEHNVLPVIVNEVSTARGNGDLSENAEYHAAKDKQRATMKKIGYLKDFKVNAQVVDCGDIGTDVVKFGSYVKIVDLATMQQIDALDRPALCAIAVFIGKTRLIDNFFTEDI